MKAGKVAEEILKEARDLVNKPLYFFSPQQSKFVRIKRVGLIKIKGEQRLSVEADLHEDEVFQKLKTKCEDQRRKWVNAKKYANSYKGARREEEEQIRYKAMKELAKAVGLEL